MSIIIFKVWKSFWFFYSNLGFPSLILGSTTNGKEITRTTNSFPIKFCTSTNQCQSPCLVSENHGTHPNLSPDYQSKGSYIPPDTGLFFLPFKQMLLGLCLISINVGSTLPPARQSVELENPKLKQREKLFLKYYSYLRSPAFSQGSKFTLQKFLHAEARRKQKSRNWVIPVKISKFPSKLSGLNLDLLSAAVFHTKRLQ